MFYLRTTLLIFLCSTCSSDIIQTPFMETAAGADVNLTCNNINDLILWYKLSPAQGPILLISGYSDAESPDKKFKLMLNEGKTSCMLLVKDVRPEDSATYLCAQSDTGARKMIFGQGTKLTVYMKSERTDPSVYKLKSKQDDGLPKSVCLVTDFPNPQTSLKVDGIESSLNVSAVLDKSTNDIWRYSTVVWNNNKDVDCRVQYGDGPEKTPKSDPENAEESCSSLSIDASFRTNPNMNTSSLTVLGFRIVTAKAIIFNLIITLRLWSS